MAKHARNPEALGGNHGGNANRSSGSSHGYEASESSFTQDTNGFDKLVFSSNDRSNVYAAPASSYGNHASSSAETAYLPTDASRAAHYATSEQGYQAARTQAYRQGQYSGARAAAGSHTQQAGGVGQPGGGQASGYHQAGGYLQPDNYQQAGEYPRDVYGNQWGDGSGARVPVGKRHKGLKRVLVVILVLLLALAAAAALYIHEFDSRLESNQSTPDEMAGVLTAPTAGEPYYILLLGSDWRENTGSSKRADQSGDNQRSDVIILARIDEANNQVTLVSVPRDTRWEHDGTVSKINEAYNMGGAALTTKVVSEVTGTPIAHTVEIHFSGLEGLVDALGGVKVTVPQNIKYWDALTNETVRVEAGEQVLNGQQAQIFARVRKAYSGQDAARQSNIRQLVYAIADGIRSKPLFEYPGLGLDIANCFGTDMRFFDFLRLAMAFREGNITMYSGTGPTEGAIDPNASGQWLCYSNPEGWKRVMDVVNAGGDPSTVDPNAEYAGQGTEYVGDDEPVYTDELFEGQTEAVYYDYVDDYYWWPEESSEPAADTQASENIAPVEEPEAFEESGGDQAADAAAEPASEPDADAGEALSENAYDASNEAA